MKAKTQTKPGTVWVEYCLGPIPCKPKVYSYRPPRFPKGIGRKHRVVKVIALVRASATGESNGERVDE